MRSSNPWFRVLVLGLLSAGGLPLAALAQGIGTSDEELAVEAIDVRIRNPSTDEEVNKRVRDQVRTALSVFPLERFSRAAFDVAMARVRRTPGIAQADYALSGGSQGGVVVDVAVDLATAAMAAKPGGVAVNGWADFPVLFEGLGRYSRFKLEYLGMYYGNRDAWYGRPDLMLDGNPLVAGRPAGPGYEDWAEGFVQAGVYGITPVGGNHYVYGGLSALASGSVGDELFTDDTRSHLALEDAYVGVVGGVTSAAGNRFAYTLVAGRKRFTLGEGLLLVNTSGNGSERAALQSNPRWASDRLFNAAFRYNNLKAEVFRVDPDELPLVDSRTVVDGFNVEARLVAGLDVAYSHLQVPRSGFRYFDTSGVAKSREGLRVHDLRARWQPNPAGRPGPFVSAELARQTHSRFSMRAEAGTVEAGWAFAGLAWQPVVSYRYARFSGDDAGTARFERWDPLFSGGNGEQWVQGINHFKVVQDSNVVAHRLQARLRPMARLELVPQLWIFRADSTVNLGGNPALPFLPGKDLGTELNLTAKVFVSRRTFIQAHVAATLPGDAVKAALGGDADTWWSTMVFIRHAF